jgi:hypothetical protein
VLAAVPIALQCTHNGLEVTVFNLIQGQRYQVEISIKCRERGVKLSDLKAERMGVYLQVSSR